MMTYRLAKEQDVPQIRELCEREKFLFPNLQLCFVAENEGKIVGFVNMALEPMIDVLISDNPISGVRLMDMVIGSCYMHKRVLCQTRTEAVVKQAEKYGFTNLGNMNVLIKEM